MPEYLAPGVYVEETSYRARSIEGVGTSVAAIVGPTRTGPLRGTPEVVTSYGEYVRTYGDAAPLVFTKGAATVEALNYTALAAKAFFDNGGKQLFVSRVVKDVNLASGINDGTKAIKAKKVSAGAKKITFTSRFPGATGNYVLELRWRDKTYPISTKQTTALIKTQIKDAFDLNVLRVDKDDKRKGEVIHTFPNLSLNGAAAVKAFKQSLSEPEVLLQKRTQPISCAIPDDMTPAELEAEIISLLDVDTLKVEDNPIQGARYLIVLEGGTDGEELAAADYKGKEDVTKGNTGLAALEQVEDIAIVMTPAASSSASTHNAVITELQIHCNKMRYRVGIVDSRENQSLSEVQTLASKLDDSRLALYYPWVVISDPTGNSPELTVPPAGFVAGIYARTDVLRGVHKAPANEVVMGALRFAQDINRFQQELLNPKGINCLRSFSGRGHRVWGGRTRSSDPEWKYVNVRRYFLYLERSIEKSTQWIVFEPNSELLWRNVRTTIEDFLYNEWFNGHLMGSKPEQAYFVRCDRSTMTQNDLDNGRLVCEIGVAAIKPAEFVIFRIGQKTAEA